MSIHISAEHNAIAKTVLLAGDPLRVEYIAHNYLEDAQLVSRVRNACYFTGQYKEKKITVGTSGMGCPSMGIYSYELYTEFEVETIIRIGTCGAYNHELSLFDLLIADISVSESTYAMQAWGDTENKMLPQGNTSNLILQTAASIDQSLANPAIKKAKTHTSDAFYHSAKDIPAIAENYGCDAVEMECFALFANAKHLQKNAAAMMTVSDIIPKGERITHEQREKSLNAMIVLALETTLKIS
jgi:purine-nucleoside phosphorylase